MSLAGQPDVNPGEVVGQIWPPSNVRSGCLEGWGSRDNGEDEVGDSELPVRKLAWICEGIVGVDKFELLVSGSMQGTVGLPDAKRLHGVIFNGGRQLSCELCFEGEKDSVRRVSSDKFSAVDSINWFIPWIWAAKVEKAFRVGVSWNAFLRTDIWAFAASSCPRNPVHCWKNNLASGWDKIWSRLMMRDSGKCSCIALTAWKSRFINKKSRHCSWITYPPKKWPKVP